MDPDRSDPAPTHVETVRLSGRDIEDAKRLLSLIAAAEKSRIILDPPPHAKAHADDDDLLRKARAIIADRRRRSAVFGKAMFGEPAWDMLLLLYAFASEARQTVTRIAESSGASKSTAIRWLDYLEQQQLVRRMAHPVDRRTVFIELTERGRHSMELYLSGTAGAES
jgi:DNA-binding MarR family transcriptional regulator